VNPHIIIILCGYIFLSQYLILKLQSLKKLEFSTHDYLMLIKFYFITFYDIDFFFTFAVQINCDIHNDMPVVCTYIRIFLMKVKNYLYED